MRSPRRIAAAIGALVALAACQDAATTPGLLDDEVSATAALVAADAAIEDLAAMNDALPAGLFGMAGMQDGQMGSRSSLVRERSVTFFDADGNEQDAFDPLTTASLHVVMSMEGEISRDAFSASISRSRDMSVSGLEGEETTRTWNGTGTESHSRSRVTDDFGTRSYELQGDATIDNVVRAVNRTTQRWPLSGTITRHVLITIVNGPNGDETRERTVVITFDGTQFPTMTVDGDQFEVDLGARDHQRPVRRRRDG